MTVTFVDIIVISINVTFKRKMVDFQKNEELHFIALNYTSDYTLHHKLFKCTFCILNYNPCYTLLPDVKFVINLDGKV